MMVKIFFSFLLIFCDFQASLSDDFFHCDNVQIATVGESFLVKCNSSSQLWSRVQYFMGKEESPIVFIHKVSYGEVDVVLREGGSEYKDGTVNITAEGILVFNSVTWNDGGEYKLEYFDGDGHQDFQTFTIEVQDPKAAVTEHSTSLTKHEIAIGNLTEITDLPSTYPVQDPKAAVTEHSTSLTKHEIAIENLTEITDLPSTYPATEIATTTNDVKDSSNNIYGTVIIVVIIIACVVGIAVVLYFCKRKSRKNVETNSGVQVSYSKVKKVETGSNETTEIA